MLALAFLADKGTTLPLIAEASWGFFLPRDLHIADMPASGGFLPFSNSRTILGNICSCGGGGGGGIAICGCSGGGAQPFMAAKEVRSLVVVAMLAQQFVPAEALPVGVAMVVAVVGVVAVLP